MGSAPRHCPPLFVKEGCFREQSLSPVSVPFTKGLASPFQSVPARRTLDVGTESEYVTSTTRASGLNHGETSVILPHHLAFMLLYVHGGGMTY